MTSRQLKECETRGSQIQETTYTYQLLFLLLITKHNLLLLHHYLLNQYNLLNTFLK